VATWDKAAGLPPYSPLVATGGATVGTYTLQNNVWKYHKFTSTSTFVVSSLGGSALVDYLLVAGGGAGLNGSGGGAGGLVRGAFTATAVTYTITIGGAGGLSSIAGSGLTTITALAGGNGGNIYANGANGGSGGGSGGGNAAVQTYGGDKTQTSPAGGRGYGNAGGTIHGYTGSGTGGGAAAAGINSNNPAFSYTLYSQGLYFDLDNGTETLYATGGPNSSGANGTANTGNGVGSNYLGGSGICILRYRSS